MKLHRTSHLLALGALLLMPSCLANAATYYSDAVNGNDANPGSSAAPWKTLTKAANTMASGDTAFVRAGAYRETVHPRSGQRFEAERGAKPLITGCEPVSGWTVHPKRSSWVGTTRTARRAKLRLFDTKDREIVQG